MKLILINENILSNPCSGFCEVCSNFAEYILKDLKYSLLKCVMLKTPIPVKFPLAALAPFCGDEGGGRNRQLFRESDRSFCISLCSWHSVSSLVKLQQNLPEFFKARKRPQVLV